MDEKKQFEIIVSRMEGGNVAERAAAIALRYGQIDGGHHKDWVIDQMLRVLAGDVYGGLIALYEQDGEYEWYPGIAP